MPVPGLPQWRSESPLRCPTFAGRGPAQAVHRRSASSIQPQSTLLASSRRRLLESLRPKPACTQSHQTAVKQAGWTLLNHQYRSCPVPRPPPRKQPRYLCRRRLALTLEAPRELLTAIGACCLPPWPSKTPYSVAGERSERSRWANLSSSFFIRRATACDSIGRWHPRGEEVSVTRLCTRALQHSRLVRNLAGHCVARTTARRMMIVYHDCRLRLTDGVFCKMAVNSLPRFPPRRVLVYYWSEKILRLHPETPK